MHSPSNIPRRFQQLFRWFCHPDFVEELEGDLHETFDQRVQSMGLKYARRAYRLEVIRMLRPSVVKKIRLSGSDAFSPAILLNHSRVVVRNIRKHTAFSLINIAGLAIGMSVGLLILAIMSDLSKFDQFHENRERIFRVISDVQIDNRRDDRLATTAIPLATHLADLDEVEDVVQIRRFFAADAKANDKVIAVNGHLADRAFFDVFTFPLIAGDPASALAAPYSIVLTEKTALKFFNNNRPIGQILNMGPYGEFQVTGIMEDIPLLSHMQFDFIGSFSTVQSLEKQELISPSLLEWDDIYTNYIYLKLYPGEDRTAVERKLHNVVEVQYKRYDDLEVALKLQPLLTIVSGPELSNKIGPTMPAVAMIILSVIALLILLSSCFNYTNLSIARSLRRSREVGVRKVVGATRQGIVIQFLLEAVLIALMSLAIGIALFYLIRPGFFANFPKATQFSLELDAQLLLKFTALAIGAGLVAGLLPALLLSRVDPAIVLKNLFGDQLGKKFTLRKILITFQFAISLVFIIGSAIVLKQYKFALNKDLGFDQEQVLNVELYQTDHRLFRNEMSKHPEIANISFSSLALGTGSTSATWVSVPESGDSVVAYFASVDHQFIPAHDIPILAGQNFKPLESGAPPVILINEAFCKRMQWTYDEALNEELQIDTTRYQVAGVVRDFNYTHLEEPIGPFFFIQNERSFAVASLHLASTDIALTLKKLERTWLEVQPDHAFEAIFLDERIDRSYRFLQEAMTLFAFLAFMAISIACLGMLGMAMYAAEVRAREISIRKVFGATAWSIFTTISGKFYRLIVIAALIAVPAVYLLFDKVILSNFAFRISIGAFELISGVLVVALLGLISIGSQTWRAARTNPSEVLRKHR